MVERSKHRDMVQHYGPYRRLIEERDAEDSNLENLGGIFMKRMSKLFLMGCLVTGTFLIGGCEEGSYSFEHNSSVEISS